MIWFAIIFALVIGSAVGIFTRNLKKAVSVGLTLLIAGIIFSFIIVYSGIMGG